MAYARRKIERTSDNSTDCVMPNSRPMVVSAGATIEEETGEMKVNVETIIPLAACLLSFFSSPEG